MAFGLRNLQEKIEIRASKEATEEVSALIRSFQSNSAYRQAETDVEMIVMIKTPQDKYESPYQTKIRAYEYWEKLKKAMIEARTQELIDHYSEQILATVDSLEYLKEEVSNIKEQ